MKSKTQNPKIKTPPKSKPKTQTPFPPSLSRPQKPNTLLTPNSNQAQSTLRTIPPKPPKPPPQTTPTSLTNRSILSKSHCSLPSFASPDSAVSDDEGDPSSSSRYGALCAKMSKAPPATWVRECKDGEDGDVAGI
jgi:hypothetical protein